MSVGGHEEATTRTGWGRKAVQGLILVALVGIIGALTFVIPESEGTLLAAGPSETGGESRIEASARPTATASMLAASTESEVEGSLDSLASTGRLSGRSNSIDVPLPGTPGDSADGFATAIDMAMDESDAPPQTTTTVWVEPELPPVSEWVDSGNGVMVPDLQLRIRFCESTNNYLAANSNSTARGAYQFLIKSWDWYGHKARTGIAEAHLATPAQQDESALLTLQAHGTGPWAESRDCWADPNIDPRYATAKPKAPASTTTTAIDETSSTTSGESTTTTGESTTTEAGSSTTDTTSAETTTSQTTGETTTTESTSTSESTTTSTEGSTTSTSSSTTMAS